jgi:hypothetical protein
MCHARFRRKFIVNTLTTASLLLLFTNGLTAADNPFTGTWKLDMSKSDCTGETIRYQALKANMVRYTGGGETYTFTTDGQPHPGLFGRVVSVKQIDTNTWQRTTEFKGKILSEATLALSPDGNTLTETSRGTRPDGSSFENTEVYNRVGEGSGILGGMLGIWRSKSAAESSSSLLEFADNGADGIAFVLRQIDGKCLLKFDGGNYSATGPTVPDGLTLSATRTGDRSFEMTEKIKGKPIYKASYTVSDDGKTLTVVGSPTRVVERTKAVYVRQ